MENENKLTQSNGLILFYDSCRLCLNKPGVCNIFDTQDLQYNIYACLGVELSPLDDLPPKICQECLEVVVKAKMLRLLANKNDLYLKSLFSSETITPDIDKGCLIKSRLLEPQTIIQTDNKTQKKRNTSSSDESEKKSVKRSKRLAVRKDLFKPPPVVDSDEDVKEDFDKIVQVKVKTKEEYLKVKTECSVGDIIYECDTCSKTFTSWKKLYLHKRLHNRKYACPIDACGKKFATKGDLEKHIRTHTGSRPYACNICEKCFTQIGTLKTHRETVHYSIQV